ncbi:hypothetical protein AB835_14155 [Candidatus Endobugula sertula]|uniref:Uncharacterized protein n=1 Tax=Candidatus Endobugula sertula TaxID=62101 RepID=A0A1D2QLJ7_9GAMM|nr:hypothetical protein AB835_14155 [Candidatus Endobugula sertula]
MSSVPLKKTIGLRLLRYVFGCYFAVTLVVTSIQLISEYIHVKGNIFQELAHLGETVEDGLSVSMWNFDIEQIKSILFGINKVAMVAGTKVTDTRKVMAAYSTEDDHRQRLNMIAFSS